MANSYVSAVIAAPIERVWSCIRDFGNVAYYCEVIECSVVGGGPADRIGAIRAVKLKSGFAARERLVGLSDLHYRAAYQMIEEPGRAFSGYVAEVQLKPITLGGQTFLEWSSNYEVEPGKRAEIAQWIEEGVYWKCIDGIRALVESK